MRIYKLIHYITVFGVFLSFSFYIPWLSYYPEIYRLSILSIWSSLILLLGAFQLIYQRKIILTINTEDFLIALVPLISLASTYFSSSNFIQAVWHPYNGFYILTTLALLFLVIRRIGPSEIYLRAIELAVIVLACIHIFYSYSHPTFSTLVTNSLIGTTFVVGFFLIYEIVYLASVKKLHFNPSALDYMKLFLLGCVLVTLTLAISRQYTSSYIAPLLYALRTIEWQCQSIRTCLMGVGVGEFSALFTQVKNLDWARSPLWNVQSFSFNRSWLLQIVNELGTLILFPLLAIGIQTYKKLNNLRNFKNSTFFLTLLLFLGLILLPPSLEIALLTCIFISLSYKNTSGIKLKLDKTILIDTLWRRFIGIGMVGICAIIAILGSYWTIRFLISDYYFQGSFKLISKGQLLPTYESQKRSILLFPHTSSYHIGFAKTNLAIALHSVRQNNNINEKIPDQKNRLIATQAIQTAIRESLTAASLAPTNAHSYEQLGDLYEALIDGVGDAASWTVASYQKALFLDPLNPYYHYRLGQIFYKIGDFQKALRSFEQATTLKSDFGLAYQAKAWSWFKLENVDKAHNSMKKAIILLKDNNEREYNQAIKDLKRMEMSLQ